MSSDSSGPWLLSRCYKTLGRQAKRNLVYDIVLTECRILMSLEWPEEKKERERGEKNLEEVRKDAV